MPNSLILTKGRLTHRFPIVLCGIRNVLVVMVTVVTFIEEP